MRRRLGFAPLVLALPLFFGGCSIRQKAVNLLGDALSGSAGSYASDDDPALVGGAVPFALKTIESLLVESPRHRGLLIAAAGGFTQYAYAWVQQEADFVEERDLARATALRTRAGKLYLRARDYGLRGLDLESPGFRDRLAVDPAATLAAVDRDAVPLLFWTGNAWGGAISLAKADAELTADLSTVEAIMRRALALDEAFAHGGIHDFFIAYEGGRATVGGSVAKAREHFNRARELAPARLGPLVTLAEVVSLRAQDRAEFTRLLEEALGADPRAVPELTLANVIAQERARWLLSHADELFIE